QLRCYLNGAEDAAVDAPGETGDTTAVVLGNLADNGTVPVRIDEARVFATARPPAQVLADATHPLETRPPRGNLLGLRFAAPPPPPPPPPPHSPAPPSSPASRGPPSPSTAAAPPRCRTRPR